VKQGAAIGRQADDLAVEHARPGAHRVRDLFTEHRKLFVDVAAAGQERALVVVDVGQTRVTRRVSARTANWIHLDGFRDKQNRRRG
jgi:hypothetical protein